MQLKLNAWRNLPMTPLKNLPMRLSKECGQMMRYTCVCMPKI